MSANYNRARKRQQRRKGMARTSNALDYINTHDRGGTRIDLRHSGNLVYTSVDYQRGTDPKTGREGILTHVFKPFRRTQGK